MPAVLIAALHFAAEKHRNQRRKDIEASPYINHPIALAQILAIEGGVEEGPVLCAAVLHDTIEDTETTHAELAGRFGPGIADVTEPESIAQDGTLFVRVATSAWAQELQMQTPLVLAKLKAGGRKIKKIVWRTGGAGKKPTTR